MPTKTEYREYLASEHWQKLRKAFLREIGACQRCGVPRWLAVVAYDQDLHAHHNNYSSLGHEESDDLTALCKRCHEVETFGSSRLHVVRETTCLKCGDDTFDVVQRFCEECRVLDSNGALPFKKNLLLVFEHAFHLNLGSDV